MKRFIKFLFLLLIITSCAKKDIDDKKNQNKSKKISFEYSSPKDFSDALLKRDFSNKNIELKPISFKENIFKIDKPKLLDDRNITISVNEDTPLKNILLKIGSSTGIDIQVDKEINDRINFSVYKKPLQIVFDTICRSSNIRYQEKDGIIIFKKDKPYVKNYIVNFINSHRKSDSSSQVSSNIVSSGTINSGSSVSISSSHDDDIMQETFDGILNIINHNKESYQSDDSDKNKTVDLKDQISINKQAGIVTVNASHKTHLEIYKYLKELKKRTSSQVLIEAKVVEVTLTDYFSAGINWSDVNNIGGLGTGTYTPQTIPSPSDNNPFTLLVTKGTDFTSTLALLKNFGRVKTIQNPRLIASHNKVSTMSFTEDKVYFEVEQQVTPVTSSAGLTQSSLSSVKSTTKTIPIGIVLYILPSIDRENNEISLIIRPTITSSSSSISDPGVQYLVASNSSASGSDITSEIPIVKTKELEVPSTLKDGEMLILGGFTEQLSSVKDKYVPFIGRIPVLGWLFRYKTVDKAAQETVIFLKATIIREDSLSNGIDDYDKDFYNRFAEDSRPWKI